MSESDPARDNAKPDRKMCQATVFLEESGNIEVLLKDVLSIERTDDGWIVSALLEAPRKIAGEIKSIDFLKHTVILSAAR
jgi:predicted RNA-binding protein